MVVSACMCGRPFAEKVVEVLRRKSHPELHLLDTTERRFANTEIKTLINKSIRGADFFLIQDCETREFGYSTADSVSAMKSALDAAFRAGVRRKVLIMLSFPYARQDKAQAREGVTASRLAQELEDVYGVGNVIYMDIHNLSIAGFFRKALTDNLSAIRTLTDYTKKELPRITKVIFADTGGSRRAEDYASLLDKDITGFQKRRDNVTGKTTARLISEVRGEICMGIEDMIDTAGTIYNATLSLADSGANIVYWLATHGIFSPPAEERLNELHEQGILGGVICTDSVHHSDEFKKRNRWYKEVSVASYVAKTIHRLHTHGSISELLND